MAEYQKYFEESHDILRRALRRFLDAEVTPHIQEWEEAESFPREIYLRAGEEGLLGIGYPEEYGGTPGDGFHKVVATEEIMRCGSGGFAASLGSLDIGLPPVVRFGSPELRERVVPPVLRGEKISCLAITEPGGGSDVAGLRTRAVRDGDHYVVNGCKTFITSGHRADFYTVAVRTGGEGFGGISLLLIERGTPGFSTGKPMKKMGWRCSDTAELFFDDCRVPVANLVGQENGGFAVIMSNFQFERLMLALMANMTAQLAFEEALRYVHEREAFGRKLERFQVIRHKLAEMATRIEASREFTYRVAARIHAGENVIKEVSMAKNVATDTSDMVTDEAVQILGGMGYMRESLVERLYRDSRILSIGGGTHEIMNEIICKQIGL